MAQLTTRDIQVSHFSMLRVKDIQTAEIAQKVRKDEEERALKDDDFWAKVTYPQSPSSQKDATPSS